MSKEIKEGDESESPLRKQPAGKDDARADVGGAERAAVMCAGCIWG